MQGFDFQILFQPQHGPFTPKARLFYPTKRPQLCGDGTFVTSYHPAFDGLRHAEDTCQILGIEVSRQAICRVVGTLDNLIFRGKTEAGRNRAKRLFFSQFHAFMAIAQDSWHPEIAAKRMGFTARQNGRTPGHGIFNVFTYLIDGGGFDQRPHDDALFQTIPDLQGIHRIGKLIHKFVVDGFLNIETVNADADLAGMDKLMWGSDYPRTITAITYKMSYDFILKTDELTEREKDLFLGENAAAFYGFKQLIELPYIKNMSE